MADEQIQQAVVHHVSGIGSHAGFGAAIFTESRVGLAGRVSEGAVSVIEVKKISLGVIGDENVGPAVAIQVGQHYCQAFAVGFGQTGFFGNVGKCSVAVIVVELRRSAVKMIRMAVGAVTGTVVAAELRMVLIVLHVI